MRDDEQPAPGGGESSPPPPERDPMGPPEEPCECWCMHCRRTFMSDGIWFQRVIGDPQGLDGFWMCPTPNCGGAGFTFDIFPTDPDHPANDGWTSFGDDEEDGDAAAGEGGDLLDAGGEDGRDGVEWDPDESKWKELDEALGDAGEEEDDDDDDDDDDDLEGEEWKHGLAPGERPPPRAPASWPEDARLAWEAEQRSFDEPDRRPRELDWSDRPDRRPRDTDQFTEDDIPF